MTVCPQCKKTYENASQKFCIDDGVTLVAVEQGVSLDSIAGTMPVGHHGPALITNAMFPPVVDPLAEGAQVGEYVVGRKIGEGGMGAIFGAVHPIIGKRVALKVLHSEMASNRDVVQRFILEAKAVNQIGHRNIVDIFSFGTLSDGRQYFAMEFLEGMSLASRLAKEVPISWSDAIAIWIQTASAIEAAHGQGIVHRDLKPDNVFITPTPDGPFLKVLDFGIAKLLGDVPSGLSKTSTGVPIGTPAYMSPEQARGTGVDNRTDIYAFGIILYETITGRPPFVHHNSFVALLTAHLAETPPAMSQFADVHPDLNALVEKCLEKEQESRPQDMRTVREELVRLRDLAVQLGQPLFTPKGDMAKLPKGGQTTTGASSAKTIARPNQAHIVAEASGKGKTRLVAAGIGVLALGLGVGAITKATQHTQPTVEKTTVVIEPPKPAPVVPQPMAASSLPPGMGRVTISTNAMATRVYLDKSTDEKSAEAAAAGGMSLKVLVPAGVNWVLRVEADNFNPVSMPLKIAAGEETSLPVLMVPNDPAKAHHGTGAPHPVKVEAATGSKKPPTNEHILNPF